MSRSCGLSRHHGRHALFFSFSRHRQSLHDASIPNCEASERTSLAPQIPLPADDENGPVDIGEGCETRPARMAAYWPTVVKYAPSIVPQRPWLHSNVHRAHAQRLSDWTDGRMPWALAETSRSRRRSGHHRQEGQLGFSRLVCDVASRFFRCNIDSLSSISLREVVAIAMDPPRVVRGMGTIREKG